MIQHGFNCKTKEIETDESSKIINLTEKTKASETSETTKTTGNRSN